MGERLTIILLMTIQWNEDFIGMTYRIFFVLSINVIKCHWHKQNYELLVFYLFLFFSFCAFFYFHTLLQINPTLTQIITLKSQWSWMIFIDPVPPLPRPAHPVAAGGAEMTLVTSQIFRSVHTITSSQVLNSCKPSLEKLLKLDEN